jgi:hypothetical protein
MITLTDGDQRKSGTRAEDWAKRQKDKPSRSEAIRRLIEFALAVKAKGQNTHDE